VWRQGECVSKEESSGRNRTEASQLHNPQGSWNGLAGNRLFHGADHAAQRIRTLHPGEIFGAPGQIGVRGMDQCFVATSVYSSQTRRVVDT
jgi:hypothetical protein